MIHRSVIFLIHPYPSRSADTSYSMRLRLDRKQKRELKKFLSKTQEKKEYRRGTAILMRSRKRRVKDIARELNVSIDAVVRWIRSYRKHGLEGLKARKRTGKPPKIRGRAEKRIREILKQDPKAFGFLKGRWVVRDIAKALGAEGINVSRSYVYYMLKSLDLAYKRPKLTVKSSDPSYARKTREVRRYKKASSALAKKGFW